MFGDGTPHTSRLWAAGQHLPYLVLALLLLAADQWTKQAVESYWLSGRSGLPIPVLGGLMQITYAQNTGGAFGILGGETVSVALLVVSGLALAFIGWYYWAYRTSAWMRLALTLVAAGAVGNLVDRIRLDYVIDFIDVDIGSYQWPFFNVADSLICVGAAMLVLHLARDRYARPGRERVDDALS